MPSRALLAFGVLLLLPLQSMPFDLAGHWAVGRIEVLVRRGIVQPEPDGRFRPNAPLRRGTFVRWLVTAKGLPLEQAPRGLYPDVPRDLAPFVEAARVHGIVGDAGLFRPYEPLRRQDAVLWTVRALGYRWEAASLVDRALPFRDADRIGTPHRGAVAVAVLSRPPLLREPTSDRFRPLEPMTRAEGASLVGAYLEAVEAGIGLQVEDPVMPGVLLTARKQGALRTLPIWRVQVGAFANPENAQRLSDRIRARGLPVSVDYLDGLYKVRVGALRTREEAEALRTELAEEGLPTWILSTLRDFDTLPGPQWVAFLRLRPGSARFRVALANDRAVGRERTSAMARRWRAVAAVNGGYFAPDGDPLGGVMVDGEWVSEPLPNRTCLGVTERGEVLVDALTWKAEAVTPAGPLPISGINRARGPNELILYTPRYGATTRANPFGVEAVVAAGLVREVRVEIVGAAIPSSGFVLSAHGTAAARLRDLRPGDPVQVVMSVTPSSGDPRWERVRDVLCAGPRLLSRGQVVASGEGFPDALLNRRHPRTAVGVASDGSVILLVADGRSPEHSLGMTATELALEMRRWGAQEAVNLDGGGSATLVVRDRVVNLPSDEAGERPVANALLVLPP
jgi:hypothetical protein